MPISTIPINLNTAVSTRRHPVENNIVRFDNSDPIVKKKSKPQNGTNRRVVKKAAKSPRPKWLTVIRVLTKILLLLSFLWCLVQISRRVIGKGEGISSRDVITVMEEVVKKSSRMMQVQIDSTVRLEKMFGSVMEELERREGRFEERLRGVRKGLEREIGERLETFLPREEFEGFVEEYLNSKVSLDDVRVYVKEVVEREIEKHASDWLGARVVKHSKAHNGREGWALSSILNSVHPNAEKMLRPSFGEPGMCFPLKG